MSWLAGCAGFVGSWILLRPQISSLGKSVVLPLGMAFCFALYLVLTRILRREGSLVNLFYTALGVFLFLSFSLPLFWQPPSWRSVLPMTAIGLLGWASLLGLDKALALMPAVWLALFAYTQLIWVQLLNVFLLGRAMDAACWVGVGLIVGGGGLLLIQELKSARKMKWEILQAR